MNVVFIIGNGFDLNLGLRTSYRDFYKYYEKQKSSSSLISTFKGEIENNHETWADLELALGKYTAKFDTNKAFFEVYDDIVENLSKYIEEQEYEVSWSGENAQKIYKGLTNPHKSVTGRQREKIGKLFSAHPKPQQRRVNVITLNYTKMLENILGEPYSKSIEIEHVHGFASERMVLGVNDASQMSNSSLQEERRVINAFVKDSCNFAMDHGIEESCKKIVSNASLICIYGSSIGLTDLIWWQLIVNRLRQNISTALILFERIEAIHPNKQYQKLERIEQAKIRFLNKLKLDWHKEEIDLIKERIFVALNSDIFDIKIDESPPKPRPNRPLLLNG